MRRKPYAAAAGFLAGSPTPNRPSVVLGLLLTGLALGSCSPTPQGSSETPSVLELAQKDYQALPRPSLAPTQGYLLISIDTLSADHLSTYGYSRETSPFLSQLAAEGVVFEEAIVQLPGTLPSHMSMLTGLYPEEHGVFPPNGKLPASIETLSERFQKAGFLTAGHTEGGYVEGKFGFDRGFDEFSDQANKIETDVERTFARGLEFLSRVGDQPFFLFLHTYVVHDPYFPAEPYASMFWPEEPPEIFPPTGPNLVAVNRGEKSLDSRQLEYIKALYDGSIRYADDQLRSLFQQIEALGLLENITVVITSDHGEEFQEHGSLVHDQVYRKTLRVPLVVLHPEIERGHRVKVPVESIDITPTFLDLASQPLPKPAVSGQSLVPYLGPAGAQATVGFAYAIDFALRQRTIHSRTATHFYHLLEASRGARKRFELFDLMNDPGERSDQSKVLKDDRDLLLENLDQLRFEPRAQAESLELDNELQERLESLGYLQ